jgi:predicted nucleotidyltransferase
VDYVQPVEALIPGAQGKILAACLRAGEPLTMRALARLAGVSANQATVVFDHLEELGLVQRQPAGRALLVTLVDESPIVDALRAVADLRARTLIKWRESARDLRPRPATLVVYGSWARGEARPGSDVDVLVMLPADLPADDEDDYREQLARWCTYAGRVAGLPVAPLVVASDELNAMSPELVAQITRDGVLIVGDDPKRVLHAA